MHSKCVCKVIRVVPPLALTLAFENLTCKLRIFVDFQAIEGSVTELIDALVAMDRHDAVSIVREALTFHTRHTGEELHHK